MKTNKKPEHKQTPAPKWLGLYERWLKRRSTSEFVVGDKLSIADFALWGLLDIFRTVDAELQVYRVLPCSRKTYAHTSSNNNNTQFAEKYPLLHAFRTRFDARPNLKAYVESDRRPPAQIVL